MAGAKIGFDIGSNALKIAVVSGSSIVTQEARLPENLVADDGSIKLPHAFSEFLRTTRKELSIPRGTVILSLPPSRSICRFVTMPEMPRDQIAINLPYEFADYVQGAPDDYVCDYAICARMEGDSNDEIPMMAAALSRKVSVEYVQIFADAGLKLKAIIPPEISLINLVRDASKAEKEFFFIDFGQQATRITVVCKDRIYASRQIPIGGKDIDEAIASTVGVESYLANTYKRNNYQDIQADTVVTSLCDRIAVEVLKVINFYQFSNRGSAMDCVYMLGGGSLLPYMEESLGKAIEMGTLHVLDILPSAGGLSDVCGFALGAAMGGAY